MVRLHNQGNADHEAEADKINYTKMAKILRLAYLTAWVFGDTATPPRFVSNP